MNSMVGLPVASAPSLSRRVASLDWPAIAAALDASGAALIGALLSAAQCAELRALYDSAERFRSRVILSKHGFGRGQYQYFRYPLPLLVEELRASLYAALAPIANRWNGAARYPATLWAFLEQCHASGQTRPTPLLLRYGAGDYNCLHQDLYGERVFPLQASVLLSKPGEDFAGGEFVLTEQRPRMQSRVEVVPLGCGDAVVFAVRHRPVTGSRGTYRLNMRHGVSRIRRGERYTLGLVLHDAT